MSARIDRVWMIGGLLAAIVLFTVAWFFLISPQNSEINGLRAQTLSSEDRRGVLLNRIKQLRKENTELQRYRDELNQHRNELPVTSELPTFLRELQAAGQSNGVTVDTLAVDTPTEVTAAGTKVHALPVTVTAKGSAGSLNGFLDKLQQDGGRAALITKADVRISDEKSLADKYDLNLSVQVFVAPPSAASVTASPDPKTK
jgi:Tfp pilus assembly protein PilO